MTPWLREGESRMSRRARLQATRARHAEQRSRQDEQPANRPGRAAEPPRVRAPRIDIAPRRARRAIPRSM